MPRKSIAEDLGAMHLITLTAATAFRHSSLPTLHGEECRKVAKRKRQIGEQCMRVMAGEYPDLI